MLKANVKTRSIFCALVGLSLGVATAMADEDLSDRDITLAVETELALEEGVPAHQIDVSTANGVVTLSGKTSSYLAKLEAEDEAEAVRGVLAVVNQIEVDPVGRSDAEIAADVISALATDPATEALDIDVDVEAGVVTLSGEVDSWAERTLAEEASEQVAGVVAVENDLTYEIVAGRTDQEIREEIRTRLRRDASIDAALVGVAVENGEVTLSGSVGSAAEKTEAGTEAWLVPGVEVVNNNLDVEWWLDGDKATDWEPEWTDANAEEAVESALANDPRVESFEVNVSVDDGVATLTGSVDNLRAKQEAEDEALDTLGVWRVKNHLRVRPNVIRTDAEIAEDVRDILAMDVYVNRDEISVAVSNAQVYLTGDVATNFLRDRAERVAAGVAGVVDVENDLVVEDYEPTVSDIEIREDIRSQLFWSPFVDSDDITVTVENGVATLRGEVEDWSEFQAAEENAREGGARSVINLIGLGYGGPAK